MWRVGRATDQEGLRLMLAFFSIDDPRRRLRLIELAEAYARGEAMPGGDGSVVLQDNPAPKSQER